MRFSHLQQSMMIIRTQFGLKHFGAGIGAFWGREVDEADAFMPEVRELFPLSNLTALAEKCRPVCVGMTWGRFMAPSILREWRPSIKVLNLEAR